MAFWGLVLKPGEKKIKVPFDESLGKHLRISQATFHSTDTDEDPGKSVVHFILGDKKPFVLATLEPNIMESTYLSLEIGDGNAYFTLEGPRSIQLTGCYTLPENPQLKFRYTAHPIKHIFLDKFEHENEPLWKKLIYYREGEVTELNFDDWMINNENQTCIETDDEMDEEERRYMEEEKESMLKLELSWMEDEEDEDEDEDDDEDDDEEEEEKRSWIEELRQEIYK